MKARDLIYWLQGFMELGEPKTLNEKQVALIKAHLNMVFIHEIDPSFPTDQQEALDKAHSAKEKAKEVEELIKEALLNPKPGIAEMTRIQYPDGERPPTLKC